MIVVVGLNPALDLTYEVAHLVPGTSHRVRSVHARAGGKAGNVARVVRMLGADVLLLGLAAGRTGDRLAEDFAAGGVPTELVAVPGETRRSVTVVDDRGATVINEPGPSVGDADWDRFQQAFRNRVVGVDALVLTGSLPPGLPVTAYAELAAAARASGVPVLVDAEGDVLRHSLDVDLVKPNAAEAAGAVGFPLPDAAAVVRAARQLCSSGARAAVISRGQDGLIAVAGDRAIGARLDHCIRGNPTGAGDALAATLALALVRNAAGPAAFDWPEVLSTAVAVSAAAVACPFAGDVDLDLARRLRSRVIVEEIEVSAGLSLGAGSPVGAWDGRVTGEDEGRSSRGLREVSESDA